MNFREFLNKNLDEAKGDYLIIRTLWPEDDMRTLKHAGIKNIELINKEKNIRVPYQYKSKLMKWLKYMNYPKNEIKDIFKVNEAKGDKEEYQKFFRKILKKYNVESPAELSYDDKKKFFEEIDAGWKSDVEEK